MSQKNHIELQGSELWKKFVDGDKKAYEVLYNLYAKDIYYYGLRITNDYTVIEDAIHDVFLKIYKNRKKLPQDIKNVKGFLCISVRNSLLNTIKSKKTELLLDIETEHWFSFFTKNTIEEEIIGREISEQREDIIKKITENLTEKQQLIMHYRLVKRLPFKEIAMLMNINVQSAKNLMQTTLSKMRSTIPDIEKYLYLISFLFIG